MRPDPRHGTVAGYNRIPCRDECCKSAYRRYRKQWNLERIRGGVRILPATGTKRRIQALVALGWNMSAIGREMGLSERYPFYVLSCETVTSATARKVEAVYERLSMRLPPEETHAQKIAASRARNRARAAGWVTSLAWDDIDRDAEPFRATYLNSQRHRDDYDEAKVLRVIENGERLDMTRAERLEVVRRLRDVRGWSEERIEQHTGITQANSQRRYPRAEEAAA